MPPIRQAIPEIRTFWSSGTAEEAQETNAFTRVSALSEEEVSEYLAQELPQAIDPDMQEAMDSIRRANERRKMLESKKDHKQEKDFKLGEHING